MAPGAWRPARRFALLAALLACAAGLSGCTEGQRLRSEALAIPVPEGGTLFKAEGPRLFHVGEQPNIGTAHYHHPSDAKPADLAARQRELLAKAGWEITFDHLFGNGTSAAVNGRRDDAAVTVQVARWGPEGGGCCAETADPARPMSLRVTYIPKGP